MRAPHFLFVIASIAWLAALSCSPSPRFFDDAGAPDGGVESMPGWRLAWAVRAGGDEHDDCGSQNYRETGDSVAVSGDGTSYLAGSAAEAAVFGPGDPNETHFPDEYVDWSDGFVARYAPDGTLGWARRIGGEGEDHATDVVVLDDGSALVTGWFRSDLIVLGQGEPNETTLTQEFGRTVGFVAEYEPDGELVWATQIPKAEETHVYALTVNALPDGRILVSGTLRGTAWPGEPFEVVSETSDSTSEWDAYLAWFDAQGEVVSAIRIGNDLQIVEHSVVSLEDGSVLAAMPYGYDELFGKGEPNETILSCPLQEDDYDCASLARYDAEGKLVWVRDLGVTKNRSWHVQTVGDGSVAIVGYFRALTDPELNGAELVLGDGEYGVLVAQYDLDDGELEWARPAKAGENLGPGAGFGITALPEGGFLANVMFGPELAFVGDDLGQRALVSEGGVDIAMVRFSATGEILWMHGMGGEGLELPHGGAQLDGRSIWLTGAYGSDPFVATSGHDDDVSLSLDGYTDVFLMRFDTTSPPTE